MGTMLLLAGMVASFFGSAEPSVAVVAEAEAFEAAWAAWEGGVCSSHNSCATCIEDTACGWCTGRSVTTHCATVFSHSPLAACCVRMSMSVCVCVCVCVCASVRLCLCVCASVRLWL